MFDTIAAISTAPGLGAIGIVRLSGPDSQRIADSIFSEDFSRTCADFESRKLYYGKICDTDAQMLDLALCTISRAPNSYTGEDTAEFQCHGSPALLQAVLALLYKAGARAALPGEFTKRAFLNGKLDLVQAEAVIDLIHAETVEVAKNAVSQLGGSISAEMEQIYSSLTNILAHFHAVIDYFDEDIEDFSFGDYIEQIKTHMTQLETLANSFERGKFLKEGVPTVILGCPNVGKSSLLNALVGFDRAIVTDHAGTTRDTLEEKARLGSTLLRLIDTAGIRETSDEIEQMGIDRAKKQITEATVALFVFDGSRPLTADDQKIIALGEGVAHKVALINKTDLPAAFSADALAAHFSEIIPISTKTQVGFDLLRDYFDAQFGQNAAKNGQILVNPRQVSAVLRALAHLTEVLDAAALGVTPDAILTEVEGAMNALGELSGKTIREEVVGRIFERFCVGK